jgi:hypothetical protein
LVFETRAARPAAGRSTRHMNAEAFLLDDLREKYDAEPVSEKYLRLYVPAEHSTMFAVLHEKLNDHFDSINRCSTSNRHYWAEPSRGLLALIETIRQVLHSLKRAGVEVVLREDYETDLADLRRWISPSGGSPVPEDFHAIDVEEYARVFIDKDYASTTLKTNIQAFVAEASRVWLLCRRRGCPGSRGN